MKCYGKWKDDQLVEVKQRFLSPSEMIEYAAGATSYLLSHQPVYVGGYEMDEASGIVDRNGHGRVMDPDTGICDYESEWENGKEIESKRISLHEGWYSSDRFLLEVTETTRPPLIIIDYSHFSCMSGNQIGTLFGIRNTLNFSLIRRYQY